MLRKKITVPILAFLMVVSSLPAWAGLTEDLQDLANDGTLLRNDLTSLSIPGESSCTEINMFNSSLENFIMQIDSIKGQIVSPLSVSEDDLLALDDLSETASFLAAESVRLSWELRSLEGVAEIFEYRAGLTAMLRLSDDIGTMADRILEMADRILVMADNIGIMADRIIITQQLQSANLSMTQASILTTQQNMVLLSDSISSIIYNLTFGLILSDSNDLVADMDAVTLTNENMAQELDKLTITTAFLVGSTADLFTWMNSVSQGGSHYISGDTLTYLGDLSYLYRGLASSLELYANTVNQLAPMTDTVILSDATASMLRLAADIGIMADRIMEMSDKIIVMADNIGLMADLIVETQQIQQANMELTESSLLASQMITVTIIKNMGL